MYTSDLANKYNVAVPRYTSYPTVPYWNKSLLSVERWEKCVQEKFTQNQEISLYIHIPFCESLCTYCGCNKIITKNHSQELAYIDTLLKEWQRYRQLFKQKAIVKQVHLGGGTPTFLSHENLKILLTGILEKSDVAYDHEFSIEAHPNYTSKAQLEVLASLGFNRISLGIQDFDPKVQKAIHRFQTYERTEKTVYWAKAAGISELSLDLVYGLPFQTPESIKDTVTQALQLKPHRIAFYGYAHVPWKSKSQRGFDKKDIPDGTSKQVLFETGATLILEKGYSKIGFDHFAIPNDKLTVAQSQRTLHRNFMGYTTMQTTLLIGLGVSAISDCGKAFLQNKKNLLDYVNAIQSQSYDFESGHLLSHLEKIVQQHIHNVMCKYSTPIDQYTEGILSKLEPLQSDGLVTIDTNSINVTDLGKNFLRNIASCWDMYLDNSNKMIYSKAI